MELYRKISEGLDDIPLCYYNTFFIYYNQYSLEVQPFTNFPKPVDCPKLFRFGFNLEPDIWEYFQLTQKTAVLANDRISCGFPGITKVKLINFWTFILLILVSLCCNQRMLLRRR